MTSFQLITSSYEFDFIFYSEKVQLVKILVFLKKLNIFIGLFGGNSLFRDECFIFGGDVLRLGYMEKVQIVATPRIYRLEGEKKRY